MFPFLTYVTPPPLAVCTASSGLHARGRPGGFLGEAVNFLNCENFVLALAHARDIDNELCFNFIATCAIDPCANVGCSPGHVVLMRREAVTFSAFHLSNEASFC
jgi:hypothetical protein